MMEFTNNFASKFKKPQLVKAAMGNIAVGVNVAQKLQCPVDTGALRRSIAFTILDNEITFGATMDYAQKQEDRMQYLSGGLKSQEVNIMNALANAFEGNIK